MNKKEQFLKDMINDMFIFSNIDMDYDRLLIMQEENLKEDPSYRNEWYLNYTMTSAENKLFEEHFIMAIMKKLKLGKKAAKTNFDWFNLQYGLKIKD